MRNEVTLAPASVVSVSWLERVYSLYIHELTRYDATLYKLNAEGKWEPDYLPYWLDEKACHPLIVQAAGEPVGFAFVAAQPMPFMSSDVDFRLCEFFILAGHRRSGIGRDAVREIFLRFRGTFELMVLDRNKAALAFWRNVVPRPLTESTAEGAVRLAFTTAAEVRVTS